MGSSSVALAAVWLAGTSESESLQPRSANLRANSNTFVPNIDAHRVPRCMHLEDPPTGKLIVRRIAGWVERIAFLHTADPKHGLPEDPGHEIP